MEIVVIEEDMENWKIKYGRWKIHSIYAVGHPHPQLHRPLASSLGLCLEILDLPHELQPFRPPSHTSIPDLEQLLYPLNDDEAKV